jgi:hypothetical protein
MVAFLLDVILQNVVVPRLYLLVGRPCVPDGADGAAPLHRHEGDRPGPML